MKTNWLIIGGLLVLLGAGCSGAPEQAEIIFEFEDAPVEEKTMSQEWEYQGLLADSQIQGKKVIIETEKGNIVFELFSDTAPLTVSNFVYLANGGYYDGVTFHRREEGFVIQGGDPLGTGTGGPGYKFEDEFDDEYGYERGIVAMANAGPNTNGSQFFVMLADTPLPKAYTVFGRVLEGMDAVDEIAVGDVMTSVKVEDK